ncbi:MAG TPA: hypothetical protein VL027_06955 [Spongiibacteraceae bacterium]|nr:hypothetical protein [Spongiibacteraceae bacterium]
MNAPANHHAATQPLAPRASEVLLRRMHAYLAGSGVTMTPDLEVQVLAVVARVLGAGDAGVFERGMQALVREFGLSHKRMPRAAPPLERGSIRYGGY